MSDTQAVPTEQKANGGSGSTFAKVQRLLAENREKIEAILPKHLTADQVLSLASQAIFRQPKLLECEPLSIVESIVHSSRLGLEFDPVMGHCALVPRYNKNTKSLVCHLWIMYRGWVELVYRSGRIGIFDAQIVHQNDEFDFEYGDKAFLKHKPNLIDPGPPVAGYALVKLKSGLTQFRVLSFDEIEEMRGVSDNKDGAIWTKWWDEMARGKCAKRLCKWQPLSREIQYAVGVDDQADAVENGTLAGQVEADDFPVGRLIEAPKAESPTPPPTPAPAASAFVPSSEETKQEAPTETKFGSASADPAEAVRIRMAQIKATLMQKSGKSDRDTQGIINRFGRAYLGTERAPKDPEKWKEPLDKLAEIVASGKIEALLNDPSGAAALAKRQPVAEETDKMFAELGWNEQAVALAKNLMQQRQQRAPEFRYFVRTLELDKLHDSDLLAFLDVSQWTRAACVMLDIHKASGLPVLGVAQALEAKFHKSGLPLNDDNGARLLEELQKELTPVPAEEKTNEDENSLPF